MDLNQLFATETAIIELKHPLTDEVLMDESTTPKPMSITILGTHTKAYQKIQRKVGFSLVKKNKIYDIEKMSLEEFELATFENEELELELFSQIIVSCNIFMEGKHIKCNPKNIRELLSDERVFWLRELIREEIAGKTLFIKS